MSIGLEQIADIRIAQRRGVRRGEDLAGKLVRLAGFAARAFRHIAEGAGKKTKGDSSLRATPFGMTTFLKEAWIALTSSPP
jgi:hypothetical protein